MGILSSLNINFNNEDDLAPYYVTFVTESLTISSFQQQGNSKARNGIVILKMHEELPHNYKIAVSDLSSLV